MTIDVQEAEAPTGASPASSSSRDERRNALVLLGCVVVTIAMVGLLLDSVTENFTKAKPAAFPADAAVPVPGARDTFQRPDNPNRLGKADSGQVWKAGSGTWGIAAGQARVFQPAEGPSLATINVGAPSGRIEVQFAKMTSGIGFAFRCKNPLNCWRVEAVTAFGTWNVIKSVRGEETRVGNLGTVPVADGTTVAVDLDGAQQKYFVNGKPVKTIEDTAFAFETRAGLSLREPAGATDARWKSFEMKPAVGAGLLAAADATTFDDFLRKDATELGNAKTGQSWSSVSGKWAAQEGLAVPTEPADGKPSLALVDTRLADGVVETTVLAPQKRSGLAFRCRDIDNCWRLEAVPGFGTWNLYKVQNGTAKSVANTGVTPTAPGTTVSIDLAGSTISVYVNGEKFATVNDSTFATETRAGLVVEDEEFSGATRWSEFAAGPKASA